jgi:tetratricopeptide (TPR) repeat protein
LPILKAAWTTHPNSFALALTIGPEASMIEAVGWSRTAVALRPNNPLAHYCLALALNPGDYSSATEELRRVIQLAPRFARAYGQLAMILRGDKNTEALAAARKAIDLDNNNTYGHLVILEDLVDKKEYVEAAKVYQRIGIARRSPEESIPGASYEAGVTDEFMAWAIDRIQVGLIRAGRPFEAYRLEGTRVAKIIDDPYDTTLYNPACAAALAGTGQGFDAPPPAERTAIRKHALEWLTSGLKFWQQHATALPILAASSTGLVGSPFGGGPLLSICYLSPERTDLSAERARDREVVHKRMNEWLQDADLAGVRDDQWLAKLPADEREKWRNLWEQVRSLRDRTAPPKPAPLPARK